MFFSQAIGSNFKRLAQLVRQYLARPATARRVLLDLVICSLFLYCAVLLFWVPGETPDWTRFLDQAKSIAAGEGFRYHGKMETVLPPGYPLFVAVLLWLGIDESVRIMQLIMLFTTVFLVYGTVVQISRVWALPLAVLYAMNPLAVHLSGHLLSETLGVFLCALAFFLLIAIIKCRGWMRGFFLGMVSVALLLTSPAAIFLSFVAFFIALFSMVRVRQLGVAVALITGGLVVMLPWQAHCFRATGGVCYLVYSTNVIRIASEQIDDRNLLYQWLRTWSLGERHIHVLHRNNPGGAPDWAFSRRSDKDLFPQSEERLPDGLSAVQRLALSEDLERKSGYFRVVIFTAVRSLTLWFDMRQIGHAQMDYVFPVGLYKVFAVDGIGQGLMRTAKVAYSSLVYLLYIGIPLVFLAAFCRFGLSRSSVLGGTFLSIFAYTIISAYSAHNEGRRNIVFFPAMILVIALSSQSRRYDPVSNMLHREGQFA